MDVDPTTTRRRWRAAPLALPALCVLAAIAVTLLTRDEGPPPPVPARTGTVTGAVAIDVLLDSAQMPPPPTDAEPYGIDVALFNGEGGVKRRWIWVPPGTSVVATRDGDGDVAVDVPVGTQLWKEFRLATDRGEVLVERRIVERVEGQGAAGWRFYAAYEPGLRATGTEGDPIRTDSPAFDEHTFAVDEWLPVQQTEESTEVSFVEAGGDVLGHVYPGMDGCAVCHGGASGAYADPEEATFAFALHPDNLTEESLARIVGRGWMTGDAVEDVAPVAPVAADDPQAVRTAELVGLFRNNCASCHNGSPFAAGAGTAFQLDPDATYTTESLLAVLSARARTMGDLGLPLVTPGDPSRSEIVLRLRGLDGRRRMPPIEGGVPRVYDELADLVERWIAALPEEDR